MYSNKSKKYPFRSAVIFMWCISLASLACGQDSVTLHIGDSAPAMRYSQWIKGTPVTSYDKDRLYVLEFWATWCGPCIASMPHLSELAKKYEAKATFIGVNVYEKTGDKPYETSLPEVTRFVKSSAGRMTYNVIADNNAKDMANGWLKPAGIIGIPTTFVVQNGKIVWIGHPMKLDSIMDPILAGTFDVAANKKKYDSASAESHKLNTGMMALYNAVQDAEKAKDFNKAFRLIDEGMEKVPVLKMSLKMEKFNILLNNYTEPEAMSYARELSKEDTSYSPSIAVLICDKDSLSKTAYQYAVDILKEMTPVNSLILDKLALAKSKAGDLKGAIETEEKAVKLAKVEVKDPAFSGRVFDYTITDFEKKVKKYKSALK